VIKDVLPNDDQFREDFKTKQEKNNQKARYLLASLETQARRASRGAVAAAELEPSRISLTLEHIFPRSPGEKWSSLQAKEPEFADDYTYRLGNLCLLTGVNRALGNKGFDRKRKVFAESDLLLTRDIAAYKEWDREAVEKRQAYMARLAAAYWRFN
jgi:hypothetical protein